MGFSDAEGGCKRHPDQKQVPGVCSSCLRERLAELSVTATVSSRYSNPRSSAVVAYYSYSSSSHSSSSGSSAGYACHRHQRNASDVVDSMGYMVGMGLTKSRSIAFAPRTRTVEGKGEKKKSGFWSKLLLLKGKREKGSVKNTRAR